MIGFACILNLKCSVVKTFFSHRKQCNPDLKISSSNLLLEINDLKQNFKLSYYGQVTSGRKMMANFRPLVSLRHMKKNRLFSLAVSFSDSSLKELPAADVVRTHQPNSPELSSVASQIPRSDILVRPKLRISDILARKDGSIFTISEDATIDEAISHVVKQNISCCLTLDCNGEVSGIFTGRDILKFIQSTKSNGGPKNRAGQSSKMTANEMFSPTVSDIIIRKEKLVYCSPDDTVRQCREIMFQLRIRNLPVIVNNELLGIVTIQDLADSAFSWSDTGGKKGFSNVQRRKGLPQGTRLTEDTPLHVAAGTVPSGLSVKNQVRLALDVASYALPHPFKHEGGVASSRRNYGASELSTDLAFCEGDFCADPHHWAALQYSTAFIESRSQCTNTKSSACEPEKSAAVILPLILKFVCNLFRCALHHECSWHRPSPSTRLPVCG